MELQVRNVNEAFSEIFWKIKNWKLQPEQTRNGPALVYPEPVTTIYRKPCERVLFNPTRDCNPIFHLMESIWMLAGRKDVGFLTLFNRRMSDFSDDGVEFNAAYGYRWRHHFGFDQIAEVIKVLHTDPASRQAVVQIWDSADLGKATKDKACNTQIIFDTRGGVLNMTVYNRSNDIWWGAYGANAVHFSFLQEFVSHALGMSCGVYRQVSHNLHLYVGLYDALEFLDMPPHPHDGGSYDVVSPMPIMFSDDWQSFLQDCEQFCRDPFNDSHIYAHEFFNTVAYPMAMISRSRRSKVGDGTEWADLVAAEDWKLAAHNWIAKREENRAKARG